MVFSDLFFLFVFLPAFVLVYTLCGLADGRRGHAWRNGALVVFSLLFYSWGEPVYVFLMVISVALNYFAGRGMVRHQGAARRRWLVAGLTVNLLILGSFKYLGFIAAQLAHLGLRTPVPDIALPIGISFYIFQSISYLVDVYRNDSPAQRRYSDLLLYVSMFPQLIAGPIVRYGTVAEEINSRSVSAADLADGAFRFLIGLGKKVIIANQFSEIADQFLRHGLADLTAPGAWVGIAAFTLQIYFDFSGYSDMAIGMGRCMGFHFRENFDHPYCADTVTDFWRRWHMSLGQFFRDYVYIPLGGNRRRQFLNLLIVWFLTGLWHGASWNFVIWGLYFGLILVVEKFGIMPYRQRIPRPVRHLYALAAIVVGWGIFYFDDPGEGMHFFRQFFALDGVRYDVAASTAVFSRFWLWMTALLFCLPVRRWAAALSAKHARQYHGTLSVSTRIILSLSILVVSVAMLVGATNNAFLYTRF